jgi:osmotically-inducible protein OsmY
MKTDAQLQQDVIAELSWVPNLDSAGIGVEVKDGIVTLAGHVESYAEKYDAGQTALRVTGVKGVAIEIDVNLPGMHKRHDADIARSAENVLQWSSNLPKDAIKVAVEDGWITLSGDVDWDYQRRDATSAVRFLMGVKGVSDQISITPKLTMKAVKADIEAALKRRAHSDAGAIRVEISGSNVTLSGTVHTWSERELAQHSAWATPGVRNVVDNITVS